jgi:hypothetical protein
MGLVGEAGAVRDIRENRFRRIEQPSRVLETKREQIAMRRLTHRLPKCAREVSRRESDFARQIFDRDPELQTPEHQLLARLFEQFWTPGSGDKS